MSGVKGIRFRERSRHLTRVEKGPLPCSTTRSTETPPARFSMPQALEIPRQLPGPWHVTNTAKLHC